MSIYYTAMKGYPENIYLNIERNALDARPKMYSNLL